LSDDSLQFDRAERAAPPGAVICASCKNPIHDAYYSLNGRTFCGRCKSQIEAALGREGDFGRGLLLAIGGGIVGGAVYFGVAALSGYEIGLIAIVVGWLVGRGMQMGSGSVGGRRYQIAAVAITYLAIAGSYFALAMRGGSAPGRLTASLLALAVALPIIAGFANPPGSFLGLLIIGIGLMQAWRMNKKPDLRIQGPFQIAPLDRVPAPPEPPAP
jgi:hypothetical protein